MAIQARDVKGYCEKIGGTAEHDGKRNNIVFRRDDLKKVIIYVRGSGDPDFEIPAYIANDKKHEKIYLWYLEAGILGEWIKEGDKNILRDWETGEEIAKCDLEEKKFSIRSELKQKYSKSVEAAIKIIRRKLGLNTAKETLNTLINNEVKQIILTGAPGTGKTYTAKKVAEEQIEGVYIERESISDISKLNEEQKKELNELKKKCKKFVQFHSSYDYTDFVEGLRPAMIQKGGEKEPAFVKLDGTFKNFCRRAADDKNKEHKYFFIIDEINRADLSRVFGELMYGLEESYRGKEHYFSTQYQNLPTYEIDEKNGVAVELKNDVFKEGFYIPENVYIIGTMNDIDRSVETFDFALRRRFYWHEVFVENEINEAFKEMFKETLEKMRKKMEEEEREEVKKALERKINKLKKEINKLENNDKKDDNGLEPLIERIEKMNKYISVDGGKNFGLNNSYQIGHAYFKDYDGTDEKVEDIFKYRIEPLLREYCRGRDAKNTKEFIDECRKKLIGEKLEDLGEQSASENKELNNE